MRSGLSPSGAPPVEPRLLQLQGTADRLGLARSFGLPVDRVPHTGWAALVTVDAAATVDEAIELARRPDGLALLVGSRAALAVWARSHECASLTDALAATTAIASLEDLESVPPGPLRCGQRRLSEDGRPVVMGVVNVTPDSFSDGGRFFDPGAAIAHGLQLVAAGAAVLDIGGESTRPRGATYGEGAVTVAVDEEIARVVPVIRGLRAVSEVAISVDTRKSAVARAALEAGADIVNDVSGLRHDPALARLCASTGATLCVMHTPADIEQLVHEQPSSDVLGDVLAGLRISTDHALQAGVDPSLLWVDPGLGFGKTVAHNRFLLRHLESVVALGWPVLVGASRKRFLSVDADQGPADRLGAGIAAALTAARRGARIVRVHDVRETVQALAFDRCVETADAWPLEAP